MSEQVGSIHYDLNLDTTKFDNAVQRIGNQVKNVGDKMAAIGKTMTLSVTLPVASGLAFAVKAASDLNETLNKIDVAFKDQSKVVKEWANTSISKMGLAKASALDAAALFGDMATAMGLNTKQAADMSMGLVQLGADMASFKNVSFERAQTALAGIYTGETEALKGLGIVMTQTNLEEFARAKGISKSIDEMTQAEKVQLRYAYVMSVTTNAQGDFLRTQSGFANQLRMTQERFKELSAEIGQKLLPYGQRLLEWVGKVMDKFKTLTPQQQDLAIKFALIAAAIGPVLFVLGGLITSIGTVVTLFGNPVFLVIAAALVAIGGALYLVWKNWDAIKEKAQPVVDLFQQHAMPLLQQFGSMIRDAVAPAMAAIRDSFNEWLNVMRPHKEELLTVAKIMGGAWLAGLLAVAFAITAVIIVVAKLVEWLAKLSGFISQVVGETYRLLGSLWNMVSDFYEAGKATVHGFIAGFVSQITTAVAIVKGMARDIMNSFKSALGIRSPSKVFEEYGVNIVEGLTKGLDKGEASIESAVNGLSGMVMRPTVEATQNTNVVPQQPVNITVNQDMSGIMTDSRAGLREVAHQLKDALMQEVQAKGAM